MSFDLSTFGINTGVEGQLGTLTDYTSVNPANNRRSRGLEPERCGELELVKAGEAEVKPRFAQLADFEREHLEIPAGVERQLESAKLA